MRNFALASNSVRKLTNLRNCLFTISMMWEKMCGLPGNCTQLVAVACDDGHEKQVELFAKNSNAAAIASIVGRLERVSAEGANGHFSPGNWD